MNDKIVGKTRFKTNWNPSQMFLKYLDFILHSFVLCKILKAFRTMYVFVNKSRCVTAYLITEISCKCGCQTKCRAGIPWKLSYREKQFIFISFFTHNFIIHLIRFFIHSFAYSKERFLFSLYLSRPYYIYSSHRCTIIITVIIKFYLYCLCIWWYGILFNLWMTQAKSKQKKRYNIEKY